MTKVILCSASPRRRELLQSIFPSFEVLSMDAAEKSPYRRPHLRVMDLAARKQQDVVAGADTVVISSDTLVYYRGEYYGKPLTETRAVEMLRKLSGARHAVYTGVAVRKGEDTVLFYDKAYVRFKKLTKDDIFGYIREYRPLDKAGAYGVQDGVVVDRYEGSFSCIMGLPVEKLREILRKMGVEDVQ